MDLTIFLYALLVAVFTLCLIAALDKSFLAALLDDALRRWFDLDAWEETEEPASTPARTPTSDDIEVDIDEEETVLMGRKK